MKKYIPYIIIAVLTLNWLPNLQAQTEITLKINHKLGTDTFAKNRQTKNNLNHNFSVKRLEYYISSIIVLHDGGKADTLKNKYLLINPTGASETLSLGTLTFTQIESIQFSIGVDKSTNHLNPAGFISGHPLAPKSPSMHWGWTAGYRFIAIEGSSGVNMNQSYELHGLWDENYFSLQIPVNAKDDNGAKLIELNANYTRILKDISLNSGVIAHGDNMSDLKALQNMRDIVFTNTSGQGNTLSISKPGLMHLQHYPNPSKTGSFVKLKSDHTSPLYYKVIDVTGKCIIQTTLGVNTLKLSQAGIYQIQAFNAQHVLLANQKQVVIN